MAVLHAGWPLYFALLLSPFDSLPPWIGVSSVSVAAGVILLLIFRLASSPDAIGAARRRAQARLLASRLYRGDLPVAFRAQACFASALSRYLVFLTKPLFVSLIPLALLFAHLDARYTRRALHSGERVVVKVLADSQDLERWKVEAEEGITVESPAVRVPIRGEIAWRIRADRPGRLRVTFVDGEKRVAKEVLVTEAFRGATPRRATASLSSLFLAPVETTIDPRAGIHAIEVVYPELPLVLLGRRVHWIVVFLVVSAAVALGLRRRMGVEF